MSIKIYGPRMGSAARAYWIAEELGLAYESVAVNMPAGEHKEEPYRKLNPATQVPTLVDGDFVLAESMAITSYLIDREGSDLAGATAQERAKVWQWSLWTILNAQPHLSTLARPMWTGMHDEAAEEKAREALAKHLPILEARLSESAFIGSDRFTVADINAGVAVMYGVIAKFDYSTYPHISAWLAALSARPAFIKARG